MPIDQISAMHKPHPTSRSGMKTLDAVLPKVTWSALFSAPDDGLLPRKNPGKKLVLAVRRLLSCLVAFAVKTSSQFSKLYLQQTKAENESGIASIVVIVVV